MVSLAKQHALVECWQKLEQARQLIVSCRSYSFFPNNSDMEVEAISCDKLTPQIAELRNWVYSQMGSLE